MSLRNTLSQFWGAVQQTLFPMLENYMGNLTPKHKKLVSLLDFIRIEDKVCNVVSMRGRPQKDRKAIARSFVAKCVFKITYTKELVEALKVDKQLRLICGWENCCQIPSESKFSRVFKEFAETSLPEQVHQAMIKDVYKGEIVGHIIKDSTAIQAREKHVKKNKLEQKNYKVEAKKKRKNGVLNLRQKQLLESNVDKMIDDLPKNCDKGIKKCSEGYCQIWKGYKLHSAVDDHCIPLAVVITSASLNDCQVAIPLAAKCNNVVTSFYDLMDAAYDHPEIKEHSRSLGHIPIIDKCPTGTLEKNEKEAESKRQKILNFQTAEQKRYKERLKGERFNALYKDYYGGRTIRYRGHSKVSCEIMFGVLTLSAALLINLVQ